MRLPIAAASGLLALVALPAAAATDTASATSLVVDRSQIEYADAVHLQGHVTMADGSSPVGAATLQVATAAHPQWRAVATDTTPSDVDFPGVVPSRTTSYRVVFAGSPGQAASTSPVVVVEVSRRVQDRVRHEQLVVVGHVQPAYVGRAVLAQVRRAGAWRFFARVRTDTASTFRVRLTAGSHRRHFRVIVPGGDGFSRWVGHYATLGF